jgi:hypothetical protein
MTSGDLLAAPGRIVTSLEIILVEHGISSEVESIRECDHGKRFVDMNSLVCRSETTQIGMGILKLRGRNGVEIVLAPECRAFFRRKRYSQ